MDKYRRDAYLKYYEEVEGCIGILANQLGHDELVLQDRDILKAILLLRDLSTAAWRGVVNSGSETTNCKDEFIKIFGEGEK